MANISRTCPVLRICLYDYVHSLLTETIVRLIDERVGISNDDVLYIDNNAGQSYTFITIDLVEFIISHDPVHIENLNKLQIM